MSQKTALQVLFVEPNNDVRDVVMSLIECTGCTVKTAQNGTEALESIEASMPDVVLAEVILSDCNALHLAKQIRSLPGTERLALVALTAYDDDDLKAEASQAGYFAFLVKPSSIHEITRVLQLVAAIKGCEVKTLNV